MKYSISILACLLIAASSLAADPAPRPNVVLLLVDDLGWQDVKCYDVDAPTPMETPNIDALAKKGVLFRQGYS
ncbi:MAG: sulfatase-like hydrolase/transferase, partial [Opitutae bacterium]|nr:sulfatase-like hydrolase/transferase [Opitutae bacterium]